MMASKDDMMRTVNDYTSRASVLCDSCDTASRQVYSVLQEVEQTWWGDSGSAMSLALYDAYSKLKQARAKLELGLNQIRSESTKAYNNWPEPEDKNG